MSDLVRNPKDPFSWVLTHVQETLGLINGPLRIEAYTLSDLQYKIYYIKHLQFTIKFISLSIVPRSFTASQMYVPESVLRTALMVSRWPPWYNSVAENKIIIVLYIVSSEMFART